MNAIQPTRNFQENNKIVQLENNDIKNEKTIGTENGLHKFTIDIRMPHKLIFRNPDNFCLFDFRDENRLQETFENMSVTRS